MSDRDTFCEDEYHGGDFVGKPCVCAGCYPNGDHGCPGCQICEGPELDCDGPSEEIGPPE